MKKRVLIPLTVQFSIRYLIRTGLLQKISEYSEPIIVLLGWDDNTLIHELESLGVCTIIGPDKKASPKYYRLLRQITYWHLQRINTPTTSIDRRRYWKVEPFSLVKVRKWIRDLIYTNLIKIPPYVENLLKKQNELVWSDTNLSEFVSLVEKVHPDAVFCFTPYFLEEELLLRASKYLHIPIATAILSFDNLTTRGLFPVEFDAYFLWNKYNREELFRIYPETKGKTVKIVGAPQFDFYYDKSYLWPEEVWRKRLNLPVGRKVILFSSASSIIVPHEDQWLRQIDQAIEEGKIIENPVVLLRRHPNEPSERWKDLLKSTKNIVFDEPWAPGSHKIGKTNIRREDIEKLMSTLWYSDVHINASSTMAVDGAILDKPQIGPAYDETGKFNRESIEIYLREHYLPITNSGGLVIVKSREELIRAINEAFLFPEKYSQGRKKIVQEICTFMDGRCTDRVSEALREFLFQKES